MSKLFLALGMVTPVLAQTAVTFHKDVLPVLQRRCQGCHRPGEVAPMPLLTYQETRPWAKAIRQAVLTRKMPPWFADSRFGKFSNDPTPNQREIDTLIRWVDSGASEGNAGDAPPPRLFVDGWNIGRPDVVWEMPDAFDVPATGVLNYQYVVLPTGLADDKWVQAAEVRPGNRAVLHHTIVYTRDRGAKSPGGSLGGFAPGMVPTILAPGRGMLLKAGSDLVLELHYTPNGTAAKDRTKVGVVFAKQPPKQQVMTLAAGTVLFKIPPGDPNYRVDASLTLQEDGELVDMMPHMHVRGKAFEYRAVHPDGRKETLLSVPRYDFNWQLSYFPENPIHLAKGAKIEATAWYDNSPNNPANPDPTKEVRYGEQTWDEMMFGWFTMATDLNQKPSGVSEIDRILNRYVEALGGKTAIQAVTSRFMKGTLNAPLLGEGVIAMYAKAPNKELTEIVSSGLGTSRTGFDGAVAWREEDGMVQELALYARRDADFYFPLNLKELYPRIELKGTEKIGGREAWRLDAPRGGNPKRWYFDAETGLLVRTEVAGRREDYQDYRVVDGIRIPFQTLRVASGLEIVIKLSEVRHNLPIDDAKFEKPK